MKRRPERLQKKLWKEYVWGKQSLKQLSDKHSKSISTIRKNLDLIVVEKRKHTPQKIHIIADVVFFGRKYGVCVFRSPKLKENLCWARVETETPFVYLSGRKRLESLGYEITSITIDGKRGVASVFRDIPVQMCLFHQLQIITRYLTRKPKLKASIELRKLSQTLTKTTEEIFTQELSNWYERWKDFLNEKTINPETGRWFFTHKRLRSAYKSLITNLPHLFTYQKYPKLNIPTTTNSLDGSFSYLKTLLRIHRGQTQMRRKKMIDEILKNQPD